MIDARTLAGLLPKPIAVVDGALRVQFANDAFGRLLGRDANDRDGLTAALSATPDLGRAIARVQAWTRGVGVTGDARWTSAKDGGVVFRVFTTRSGDELWTLVFDDISAQVRSEDIQQRTRTYLEAVLNHLPVGVITLDMLFRVTFLNREQSNIFARMGMERPIDAIIGATAAEVYTILSPQDWHAMAAAVFTDRTVAVRSRVPAKGGPDPCVLQISAGPLLDRERGVAGAVCITEDVTRRVSLEADLVRKERMALVGQMSIALNHEINNPLTVVLGAAESMALSGGLSQENRTRLESLRDSAMQIARVTRQLAALETIELTEYVKGGPMMVDLQPRKEPS